MTVYDRAWQALTGRAEPWGGCAEREAVLRIAAPLAQVEQWFDTYNGQDVTPRDWYELEAIINNWHNGA